MRLRSRIPVLLLALPATLGAQSAPAAPVAPTWLPTMGIYGKFDVYMGYQNRQNNPGASSVVSMDNSGWAGSRLGLTAAEQLWGDNKMNLDLENGYMADSGALATNAVLFNRQCWGGFSGGWGEFRFGRQNTVQQTQLGNTDPFDGATYGSFFNNFTGYNSRMDNVVGYRTTNLNGWVLQGMFAPGEQSGSTPGTSKSGLNFFAGSVEYLKGPLYVLSNFETQRSANALVTVNSAFECVSYDFTAVKVYASMYRGSNVGSSIGASSFSNGVTTASGTSATTANSVVSGYNDVQGLYYNGYELSALAPVTKKLLLGGLVGWAKDMDPGRSKNAAGVVGGPGSQNDVSEWSVIAQYWATPNVLFYGVATQMSNKDGAAFKLGSGATVNPNDVLGPKAGKNVTGIQAGFCWNFGGKLF